MSKNARYLTNPKKGINAYINDAGQLILNDSVFSGEGGGGTYEIPTGTVNGTNDDFTFTAPPILVFRNGVMEKRLGTVVGNVFTFDTPPETGDDIEGLV